ncbi:hypothetical protein [Actinomadura verrucosospora]|nr:hypothetical protein [Actinomadura verrucosospora]
METDYERRLRETVEKIKARSSIRTKYDRGPLAVYMERAEDAFEIIRKVEEIPLSAELTRNFHRYSSLLFSWRALDPFKAIAGEFRIMHIGEAVIRGIPRSMINPAAPEEVRQLVEEFKIFETHPVGGTGTYSALRLTRNQDSPEIWYFDIRQGPTRLRIGYGDYLDVMLRTRGLYHWQYLFAEPDPDNYGMCASLPYLRDGLDFLAHEFPDDDLSDLRARLEERMRITGEES